MGAYDAGATGRGVKLAVIDSGLSATLPEFAGRIDPASRDMVSDRGVTDNEGHGTAVTAVAAAGLTGNRILGVAFDSTIISLNTADPDDCDPEGCNHFDSDIARALDVAREAGARVINISLGGGRGTGEVLNAAIRATQAGVVIVISAGNDYGDEPDEFSLSLLRNSGNGHIIIAGAHDGGRQLAEFSNKAGDHSAFYVAALGTDVTAPDHTGDYLQWNGTSLSAPVISGAVALLAGAFPNLTGAQIVQLLLDSADDAGAAGSDPVYGRGILNIARAFQPSGQTILAGSGAPVMLNEGSSLSGAMGDASVQSARAVILDSYKRAYTMDVGAGVARAPQARPLTQALAGDIRSGGVAGGAMSLSLTVDRARGRPFVGLAQAGLSYEDSREARAVAGMALSRLSPSTAIAMGFSESGRALQKRLSDHAGHAFLIARDPLQRNGFDAADADSIAVRHDLGPVALTVAGERGRVFNPDVGRTFGEPSYALVSISAERRIGPLTLALGGSRLTEEASLLGARFASGFARGGSATSFADASAELWLGGGWSLSGNYRRGWSVMAGSGALLQQGRVVSDAFSLDVGKSGAFAHGDRLAFRVMQPLRVRSGGFDLNIPVSYDYSDESVGYETRRLGLAPGGRERDFEAAYGLWLLGGSLDANLFLRREPGHVAAMPDDVGGAIRFRIAL